MSFINQSLTLFSDVFRISDMMIFVCLRPGMTSVCNLQFCYICDTEFLLKLLSIKTTCGCKSIVLLNYLSSVPSVLMYLMLFTLDSKISE
jgi:hypothetical protein